MRRANGKGDCDLLTLFTWGYWGWGNATRQLVQVVDATERKKGFKPPVFFDIRYSRSVRAQGFRGDAFERLLPKGRYRWFRRLGNQHIATGEGGVKIVDPFAAKILLEEAVRLNSEGRRMIFFCACPFPRHCHRHIVANLVLDEAARTGRQIQIVEWPGGAPIRAVMPVTQSIYDSASKTPVDVPLNGNATRLDLLCLPWGSIVDVQSGSKSFPIITGPSSYQDRWLLPIWERPENAQGSRLRSLSERFRQRHGLQSFKTRSTPSKSKEPVRALTIRQPWAHAIVHLGKDVENRSWRANYSGLLLIHASARQERDPRALLADHMATPPSQKGLEKLPTGSIIGVADLFDYVEDSRSKWAQRGAWHWLLRNVRPIRPVECTGRLGLWTPGTAVMRKLPGWIRNLDGR